AGLLCAGAAALAHPRPDGPTEPAAQGAPRAAADERPRPGAADGKKPDPTRPEKRAPQEAQETPVTGRVIDAQGKPVGGPAVAATGGRPYPSRAGYRGSEQRPIAEGKSGDEGRFRLTPPPLTNDRYWTVYVLARAPGYGLGFRRIQLDSEKHNISV